jgi:hypothetical protein
MPRSFSAPISIRPSYKHIRKLCLFATSPAEAEKAHSPKLGGKIKIAEINSFPTQKRRAYTEPSGAAVALQPQLSIAHFQLEANYESEKLSFFTKDREAKYLTIF